MWALRDASTHSGNEADKVLLNPEIKHVLILPPFIGDTDVHKGLLRQVNLDGADLDSLQEGCV